MSDPRRIVCHPRPATTPKTEAQVLAAAYRFILDSHAARRTNERLVLRQQPTAENPAADRSGRGVSDGTEHKEDSAYGHSISE